MKRIFTALAVVGFLSAGSYAVADDVVSDAGMAQQHKAMKDCMSKYAASKQRMTKDDIEKACKEEVKAKDDNSNAMSNSQQK